MTETDFIPNFIYQSTSGEISNNKSAILQYKSLSFISYENTLNIWDLKTFTLIKSLRNKKYAISSFEVNEDYLIIGLSNGLLQVYRNNEDFDKTLEYKIHTKRIVKIILIDHTIYSASSDGFIYKYNLDEEKGRKITQTASIDTIDYKNDLLVVGTGDSTLMTLIDEKEHFVILNDRLKVLLILDIDNFLFVFRNNEIKLYNKQSDTFKDIKKLKKIKSIKCIDNKLYILSDKKLYIFRIKSSYSLIELDFVECKSCCVDFTVHNDDILFITKENTFIRKKTVTDNKNKLNLTEIGYHNENILNLEVDSNKRVCSISKDKLVIWNIENNKLFFYNQISLVEGRSFCIFNNFYVIGERHRVLFIEVNNLKICKSIVIEESGNNNVFITTSKYSEDFNDEKKGLLCIAINQKVEFYDTNLEIVDTLDLQDYISSIKLYNDYLFIGLLNSKVYIYDNNKDLYKTLYGHSLPVLFIEVNEKFVYTIGADKMLKIWGMDFGDCRKSIIASDSTNLQLISKDLFILGGSTLKYYQGFKLFHEKKYFNSTTLLLDKDYLIGANGKSLNFYSIDEYELDKINEDSEDSTILDTNITTITNIPKYEEFINFLDDTLSLDIRRHEKFNKLVNEIALGELNNYVILLSSTQILSLLELLEYCENTIVLARIFSILINTHKDIIGRNKKCLELRNKILHKLKTLRDKLGKNTYKIIIKLGLLEK